MWGWGGGGVGAQAAIPPPAPPATESPGLCRRHTGRSLAASTETAAQTPVSTALASEDELWRGGGVGGYAWKGLPPAPQTAPSTRFGAPSDGDVRIEAPKPKGAGREGVWRVLRGRAPP